MKSARWSGSVAGLAPVSFCVMGLGEEVHWVSLALMKSLHARGYRITGLLPLAHDAKWRQGHWRSEQVVQLQDASSFRFPISALCTAPQPDPQGRALPQMDAASVADSYAVLATWADVVVVDGLADPDDLLAPGLNMSDVAQVLGLPVIIACGDSEAALQESCQLVSRLRGRGLDVVAWVQTGSRSLACAAGIPCVGAVPCEVLYAPARAAQHMDVDRLLLALHSLADPPATITPANGRKTQGRAR